MTNGASVIGHAERKRFRLLGSSVLAVVLPAAVIGHAERKRFRLLGSSVLAVVLPVDRQLCFFLSSLSAFDDFTSLLYRTG